MNRFIRYWPRVRITPHLVPHPPDVHRPPLPVTSRRSEVTTTRVAFRLQIAPDLLDEYIARHTPVRAEMLAEIAASGRRNYSLFLDHATATLFGYYETDDDAAAQRHLAASPVAARWEAEMAPFFVGLAGRPDQAATPLTEIFHLQDQLNATNEGHA
jgi:L-rhamnose mutarotase